MRNQRDTDIVLENGVVYTVDAKQSRAQALAIHDGKIIYVGDNASAAALKNGDTKTVDLKGKMVLPGLVDSHNHTYLRAESMFWVVVSTEKSLQRYKELTQEFLSKHPKAQQVRSIGFDLNLVHEEAKRTGRTPAQLLDEIVGRDIPAVFINDTHHHIWVNSRAIKNAGVTKDTPDPKGAIIERDASGNPSGIFQELGAHNLIISALPAPDFTVDEFKQAVLSFQREFAGPRGITSVRVPVHYPTLNYLYALQQLDNEDKMTLRQDLVLMADENRGTEQIPDFVDRRKSFSGKYFQAAGVKIYGTGVPPQEIVVWDQDVLNRTVVELDKLGFRIFVHVIWPPNAYETMLDAFEYAIEQNGKRDSRHAFTHVHELASPSAERFAALGVWADGHPAPKAFYDAGVKTTLSSDYPAFEFPPPPEAVPFLGFTRAARPLVQIEAGVRQGVPIEAMIRSCTLSGAELIFAEEETGSLEVGKLADVIVLDKDITAIPHEDILDANVLMTMFSGRTVYRAPDFVEAAAIPIEAP